MALGIARQQTSGSGERAMVLQRGERIRQLAFMRHGIVDAIGREQRQPQSFRDLDRDPVSVFFFAMKMPLQFNVNIGWAEIRSSENLGQALYGFECRSGSALRQRNCQRSFSPTGQANQTADMFGNVPIRSGGSFFAPPAQFHFRNQAAQILIASARSNQQRKPDSITK